MDTDQKFMEPAQNEQVGVPGEGQAATVEEPAAETALPLPEPQPLSAAQIEELKVEAAKAKEHWDKLLRTAADFDNFKKRAARERLEVTRYANESLLQRLIPVLDSFESALINTGAPGTAASGASVQAGINMIHQQLKAVLVEAGLEEIDATNKPFNPNWHEAIAQQESADLPEGQVVLQTRKGYKLRDRLLRPATVVVSKRPAAKSSA